MDPFSSITFESLAEKMLGAGFPGHLAGRLSIEALPPDAQGVVLRALNLMKQSGYCLTEFNPVLIQWLASTLPSILPSAWGDRVPPITIPGRHQKFDDYVAGQFSGSEQRVFVDLGCGFPPVTTADTAARFPGWQIHGVDRAFPEFILYDRLGQYASFDGEGRLLYVQPAMDLPGKSLYAGLESAKRKFSTLFNTLCPLMPDKGDRSSQRIEKDGNRLIRNHIADFAKDNLCFTESDIMDLPPMNADIFRCMNLFLYFNAKKRDRMMGVIKGHLKDKGLLIVGTNSFGIQARYFVYRKKQGDLVCREFAFSLDNLGHISIMPWFTLHDYDPEAVLLAELSRTIRSAPWFRTAFNRDQDRLLEYHGVCSRRPDGFLHFPKVRMLPDRFLKITARLWKELKKNGYPERAVDYLETAGYKAWINPAKDLAIHPSPEK